MPANAPAANAPRPSGPSMPLLDVLKGLACLTILAHHFALYGPLADGAAVLAPGFFHWLTDQGRLAVEVFLVAGGFLSAASLAPEGALRVAHPGRRILQRYARLVLPYLAALSVTLVVSAWARPWLDPEVVPAAPTWLQLLTHGLLLQDLLRQDALSTGVWYVAVDFQLFSLALGVVAVADLLRARSPWAAAHPAAARWWGVALVLAGTAASLLVFNRYPRLDATALYFFGAYGLGMLTFWIGRARRPALWWAGVLALAALGLLALLIDWRSRIAFAVLVALGLALAQRRGWLAQVPPGAGLLERLGRMSYSLFLIHFSMLLLVNMVAVRWWPMRPWLDVAGLLLGAVLAVAAGAALNRWVERRAPSPVFGALALGVYLGLGWWVGM